MAWYAVTVEVAEGVAEDVAASLLDAGAAGAEVRDRTIAPMPGAARPPPGLAHVVAFFGDRASAVAAAGESGAIVEVAEQDWSEAWKEGLSAFTVGRLFVRPSWIAEAAPTGKVELVIDPGMAFGTGTHPTTALCLAGLDGLLRELPGGDVLDVGTGSGLLAIAAKKLGAQRVVATDDDPVALRVAQENADRNGVRLELCAAQRGAVGGHFGIVVANILANTLVELAPALAERVAPGGTVLLSGILGGQEQEVRAAYLAQGLVPRRELDASEGEWRLVAVRRRA